MTKLFTTGRFTKNVKKTHGRLLEIYGKYKILCKSGLFRYFYGKLKCRDSVPNFNIGFLLYGKKCTLRFLLKERVLLHVNTI